MTAGYGGAHNGRLRVEGYRCWVVCACGWETFHSYHSEHDAWTAHEAHRELAGD